MAVVNSLRTQVDLPVWEWMRFAPAVSSAISSTCTADNATWTARDSRYIYYLIAAAAFWRYDTYTDTYSQLSSPPTAPLTFSSMIYSSSQGYYGKVISATGTTFTSAAIFGNILKGLDVKIIGGTGVGQQRVITSIADPVVADFGVATAVAAGTLTDSTKAWTINQWVGYQMRITFGSGISQVRKILYNSATVLTFIDTNKYAEDKDCNATLATALSAAAGSQSVYAIESSIFTIDSAWGTNPDATSRFLVQSGGLFLASGAVATPFYTMQYYDVAADTWYIRNAISSLYSVALTDFTIEAQNENSSIWEKSIATSGTTTTLVDTTRNWTINQWTGYWVRIYSGTAVNQLRLVTSNTSTALTFATGTSPDATSRYLIEGFTAGTATSATSTTLVDTAQAWSTNRWANLQILITSGTGAGQVKPILSNTATAITIPTAWATTPDTTSTYRVQGDNDKLFIMAGGQAMMMTHNIDADYTTAARLQDYGVARIGSAQYSDQIPVAIATITFVTTTATVTTVNNHNFKTGWTISHGGATGTDASKYNIAASITVTGATTYTYTIVTPTANAVFTALSATVMVDGSKNWTTNQWAGYTLYFNTTQGPANTGQAYQIASNTATSLTLTGSAVAPVNGISRYVIAKAAAIGASDSGIATGAGQSTTTLQDTTKTWVVNFYAGSKVKFMGGTGNAQELTITSNTANTLTFGAGTAPVAANTTYSIIMLPARGTGIELSWLYGQSDVTRRGSYFIVPRGGAAFGFDKLNIQSDAWSLMTISPQFETLTTGSMYAYDGGDRFYFTKEVTQRVYYISVDNNTIYGAGLYPYTAGTAIIGNRLEVYTTFDGLKYLWLNRHSNLECFRMLAYF